jgi:predicted metal-dependent phosphoesterase TrpH
MTNNNVRVCLHNHTKVSRFGLSWIEEFRKHFRDNKIDKIAITDHNRIDGAIILQKELGEERIIIGEEVLTEGGEIIGLFLREPIKKELPLEKTCDLIKNQGGGVYVPHPGMNEGVPLSALEQIIPYIDIIEGYNGWTHLLIPFKRRRIQYLENIESLAEKYSIPVVSSSDSHMPVNIGNSYTIMEDFRNARELITSVGKETITLVRNKNRYDIKILKALIKGGLSFIDRE